VGSAHQADGQSSSVPVIIRGTHAIHNFGSKYNCSTHIIKIPKPHNPQPTVPTAMAKAARTTQAKKHYKNHGPNHR